MCHAKHNFLGAVGAGTLNDLVQHRDQALATFNAEALGAWILGAQILLQTFSSSQALKQVTLGVRAQLGLAAHAFDTLLEPAALGGIDDVHVLDTEVRAVGHLQCVEDFTQSRFVLADLQFTRTEHGVQVSVGQVVIGEGQINDFFALPEPQRVKVGSLMATHPEGLDQAQDIDLFLFMLAADSATASGLRTAVALGEMKEVIADGGMGYVRTGMAVYLGQLLEIAAPLFGNAVRILQIELIKLFNIGGIPTVEVRGTPQLLHYAVWHAWSPSIRGHHLALRPLIGKAKPCHPRETCWR